MTDSTHKCRRHYCQNRYTDTIGEENSWRQSKKGAECVPCLYAVQMVSQGMSPEQVEAAPELLEMFLALLDKTGWTWWHVKESHSRLTRLPDDVQQAELMM